LLVVPAHAPTSTLFPYTTLFRSPAGRRPRLLAEARGGVGAAASDPRRHARRLLSELRHLPRRRRALPRLRRSRRGGGGRVVRSGDRKSTRLNSSHRTISYAVLCL